MSVKPKFLVNHWPFDGSTNDTIMNQNIDMRKYNGIDLEILILHFISIKTMVTFLLEITLKKVNSLSWCGLNLLLKLLTLQVDSIAASAFRSYNVIGEYGHVTIDATLDDFKIYNKALTVYEITSVKNVGD